MYSGPLPTNTNICSLWIVALNKTRYVLLDVVGYLVCLSVFLFYVLPSSATNKKSTIRKLAVISLAIVHAHDIQESGCGFG